MSRQEQQGELDFDEGTIADEPRCPWCGEVERFEVAEAWLDDRSFTFDACCKGAYAWGLEEWRHADRETRRAVFADAGIAVRTVVPSDLGVETLDYGLELVSVDLATAKAFVRDHHRHNAPPAGWRWGHGIRNGRDLIAIAMVGRPVARRLDATRIVEVNRVCVRELAAAPALGWNACSMLYGAAAREARRRGFALAITYTLESEPGIALKAAGWKPAAVTRGGSWNRAGRPRVGKAPIVRKVRWEKAL